MPALELDLEAFKLLEASRESVDESHLAILKRALRSGRHSPASAAGLRRASSPAERQTGAFAIRVEHRETIAHSQKAAYKQVLIWLAERQPEFLDRLSNVPIRSRRIVAPSREGLYRRAGLARFAEPLCEGWFADLNLSKQQKLTRLRQACQIAGLVLGRDVEPGFR